MNFKRLLRVARDHPVARNAISLYALKLTTVLFPLVTVPYLARVLEPRSWGVVLVAQSFASAEFLILEYGFNFTATRDIAQSGDDVDLISEIVTSVAGAKLFLILAACLVGIGAFLKVPIFRTHPAYLALAVWSGVAQGLVPFWYFQGRERMTLSAQVSLGIRVLALIALFFLVRRTSDAWKVLLLDGCSATLSSFILGFWMLREIRFGALRRASATARLRDGWNMFLFRAGAALYNSANVFILGFYLPPGPVANYGGAERLSNVAISMIDPLSQALYPRISALTSQNAGRASKMFRTAMILMLSLSGLLCVVMIIGAPLIIHLVLGARYHNAVPFLRVLSLSIPIIALGTSLGVQWALPNGYDRAFSLTVLSAGMLNVLLARLLVPRFGPLGLCWGIVTSESFVVVSLLVQYFRHSMRTKV
jgi:PST family polysaccharide transporter